MDLESKEGLLKSKAPPPRPFPSVTGGVEFTYDQEGKKVSPGHRGASFAPIGAGPYATIYRGRGPTGEFALKVQNELSPVPNLESEERFRREYDALVKFGGADPGLPSIEPVPGFEPEGGPPRFEPLALCREQGTYFHLPCPRCMRVHTLADCRDEGVLAKAGLPAYATGTSRFVWCTACGQEDPAFYARKKPAGSPLVDDFQSLVTSLRSTVDRGVDEAPLPSELLVGLNEEFPCQTCDSRAECYPREDGKRGLAEVRLVPVCMNEFYAYPLPLRPLHFDEAADLLSGALPGEMMKRYGKPWASPPLRQLKGEAVAGGSTSEDPSAAVTAKVDLVIRMLKAVNRLHSEVHWPHLAVAPRHVLVSYDEVGAPSVQLAAPQGPLPLKSLKLPPPDPATTYTAPALHSKLFGNEVPVRLHIQKVWSGKGDTFFAVEIRGEKLPTHELGEDDQVRLTLDDAGWEGIEIWGSRLPVALGGHDSKSISIVTSPATLDITQVNDLKSAKGGSPMFGKVRFYRDYGVPFDVHSAGMLLFRALLVNEVQSWETVVDEVLGPVVAGIQMLRANRPDATAEDFEEVVRQELGRDPVDRISDRRNVWNRPDETKAMGISESAWQSLLTVGFRAITRTPGFSYCGHDRDFPEDDPGAPTAAMLGDLEALSGQIVTGEVEEDDLHDVQPLTSEDLQDITGEVTAELQEQIEKLTEELDRVRRSQTALQEAWTRIYKGVVGLDDKIGPPESLEDARIPVMEATVKETLECVLRVVKSVAQFGGDELGEDVPKIRVMIQDAMMSKEGVRFDPEPKLRRIRRQLKALQLFLFGTIKTFLEAHTYATKQGTESLLQLMEKSLFEVEGKKKPNLDEIRRRFARIAEELPAKHSRVFQPFFQEFVRNKLKKLN